MKRMNNLPSCQQGGLEAADDSCGEGYHFFFFFFN
jgi:hypothetical protein